MRGRNPTSGKGPKATLPSDLELQIERALSTAEIGRTSAGFTAAIRSLKGGSQRRIDAKVGLSPQKLAALYLLAAIDNCSLSGEISQAIDFRLNSRRGFWQPAITRALLRTEAPQEGAKEASPPSGAPPGAAGRAPERAPAAQTPIGQESAAPDWSVRYRLGLAHQQGAHEEQSVPDCTRCQWSAREASRSGEESRPEPSAVRVTAVMAEVQTMGGQILADHLAGMHEGSEMLMAPSCVRCAEAEGEVRPEACLSGGELADGPAGGN